MNKHVLFSLLLTITTMQNYCMGIWVRCSQNAGAVKEALKKAGIIAQKRQQSVQLLWVRNKSKQDKELTFSITTNCNRLHSEVEGNPIHLVEASGQTVHMKSPIFAEDSHFWAIISENKEPHISPRNCLSHTRKRIDGVLVSIVEV